MAGKYFIVQTLSTHQLVYLIETEGDVSNAELQEQIEQGAIKEFSQEFLGEKIVGLVEISESEMKRRTKQ